MNSKKIYTQKFRCSVCHKPIEEYSSKNKSRTIKSWTTICNSCLRKIEKQQSEIENRIVKLEKKIFGNDKIVKQCWYVITYQDKKSPEEVIGFRQALAFRRKKDAEAEYKKSGYKKPKRKIRIIYF